MQSLTPFRAILAASGLTVFAATAAAADKPNILWLTSEDHGPEMGCYGDANARTPNVDALAAKGMIFKRVWSTAPVCAPARSAIISGLYTSSSGGQHMRSMVPLPKDLKLYPQFLREAGYYSVNNSKEDYNVRKTAGLWDDSSARAHWRNRTGDQPFFAVFNSTKSHESQIRTRPHTQIADPARMRVPAYHPDTPEVRRDWAQYYDKVSEAEPPAFLFGERGRMDERMDLVRSVTDGRHVYLRNYFPHVSQGQRVAYQLETPTTRIWRALFDQGKTTEAQSTFWRVPKAPEELYDLQTDPDEVRNLAQSPAHRATLEKLRSAQRDHLVEIRDVCLLPEGEIHSRSEGSTPYEMAREETRYPLRRIVAAAELASHLEPGALPELNRLLADSDSAVRYWAALGFLMRGQAAVASTEDALSSALNDASPYVRIVAAEALGRHGRESARASALTVLRELAPPEKNGVFVSMSALAAIEALGERAASLHDFVRNLNPNGPSPDARFNSYVPQLIQEIAREETKPPPTPKAKGKAAKERKAMTARQVTPKA